MFIIRESWDSPERATYHRIALERIGREPYCCRFLPSLPRAPKARGGGRELGRIASTGFTPCAMLCRPFRARLRNAMSQYTGLLIFQSFNFQFSIYQFFPQSLPLTRNGAAAAISADPLMHPAYTAGLHNGRDNREDRDNHRDNPGRPSVWWGHCADAKVLVGCRCDARGRGPCRWQDRHCCSSRLWPDRRLPRREVSCPPANQSY